MRGFKNKEKEQQENINMLKAKLETIHSDREAGRRNEQRRIEQLEAELQAANRATEQQRGNVDALHRNFNDSKEEIYLLKTQLSSKDDELRSLNDRYKGKISNLKKEMKEREKDYGEVIEQLRSKERASLQSTEELDVVRAEIQKVRDIMESERAKFEAQMAKERQRMQLIINQHETTIQDLLCIKKEFMEENRKLKAALSRKEAVERQRKQLLRTELK